jgi:hypothetical protein
VCIIEGDHRAFGRQVGRAVVVDGRSSIAVLMCSAI